MSQRMTVDDWREMIDKTEAQSDAEPDSRLEELVSRWETLKDGGGPRAPWGVLQDELLTIISLARKGLTVPPRPDVSAGLIEAAELAEEVAAEDSDAMARLIAHDIAERIRALAADRSGKMSEPDHKPDRSGLDDGPWLPRRGPRKKPAQKTREEMAAIRTKAWKTRRAADRSGK